MRIRLLFLVPLLLLLLLPGAAALAATSYQVQPGNSLYLISQRFGVSVSAIQQANGLTGTSLYPGQSLTIPSGAGFTYTVQTGDTLYKLSQRFSTDANAIRAANNLPGSTINPGQSLWIPAAADTTYHVQPGDTLYLISQRFNVSYRDIMQANGLNSAQIYPGQTLRIPQQGNSASVSRGGASENDLALLARLVYAEARGELYSGQVGVAAVVINRVKSSAFPNTIPGVIYQPGAFTALEDGQFYSVIPDATARKAALDAVNGWDPTGGAIYYWNPAVATNKWIWSRTVVARIGNHIFAI